MQQILSALDAINENEWKPMRQPETNPSVEIAVLLIIRRIVRRTAYRCICGFITHTHTHTHADVHAYYYNFGMTFAVHNKLLCSPFAISYFAYLNAKCILNFLAA